MSDRGGQQITSSLTSPALDTTHNKKFTNENADHVAQQVSTQEDNMVCTQPRYTYILRGEFWNSVSLKQLFSSKHDLANRLISEDSNIHSLLHSDVDNELCLKSNVPASRQSPVVSELAGDTSCIAPSSDVDVSSFQWSNFHESSSYDRVLAENVSMGHLDLISPLPVSNSYTPLEMQEQMSSQSVKSCVSPIFSKPLLLGHSEPTATLSELKKDYLDVAYSSLPNNFRYNKEHIQLEVSHNCIDVANANAKPAYDERCLPNALTAMQGMDFLGSEGHSFTNLGSSNPSTSTNNCERFCTNQVYYQNCPCSMQGQEKSSCQMLKNNYESSEKLTVVCNHSNRDASCIDQNVTMCSLSSPRTCKNPGHRNSFLPKIKYTMMQHCTEKERRKSPSHSSQLNVQRSGSYPFKTCNQIIRNGCVLFQKVPCVHLAPIRTSEKKDRLCVNHCPSMASKK